MARLPKTSIEKLRETEHQFGQFTGIEGFRYEEFEEKAEELEKDYPGKGYQRAYEETMVDLFGKLLHAHVYNRDKAATLRQFLNYSEILFDSYLEERRVQKMPVAMNPVGHMTDQMLKDFDTVLYERKPSTICADVFRKFDDGQYSLLGTRAYAKARKDTVPTREEALVLVSQVKYLQQRNNERSLFWKIFAFPIHFMELSVINDLTALASKQGEYYDLLHWATNESPKLMTLKSQIDAALFEMDKRDDDPWIGEKEAEEINAYAEKEMALDDKIANSKSTQKFNRILDGIGYGASGDELNDTLYLGNNVTEADEKEGDGVSLEELLDSDVEFGEPTEDARKDFEKVAFDEAEFELFPKHGDVSEIATEAPAKDSKQMYK